MRLQDLLYFHLKQVVKFNFRNKFRLILAILVIGIAISTMFTLNGLLDIFSKNITTTILDQLPDSDFSITADGENYIYNYTDIITSIEKNVSIVSSITARYTIDGGIFLNNSEGDQFVVPTQIIAINLTKENEMHLGSFNPVINDLPANQCLVIGNFGKQLVKASPNGIIDVSLLLKPNFPVNLTLTINKQVDQNKKFYTGYQNLIIIDYKTLDGFNLTNTATSLLGLFSDHEDFYSLNTIDFVDQIGVQRGSDIQNTIGYDYNVNLLILFALSASKEGLMGQRVLVNLIGLIMVLLSTILIFSIMNTSFKDLTHEYGIYKSIGLKNRWIFFNAFWNTIVVGTLGLLFGLFMGFIFISLANSNLGDLNTLIEVNPDTFFYIILIGIVMIVSSGLYPAYITSKKNVLVSLDVSRTESADFANRVESFRFSLLNKKNIVRGFQLSSIGLLLFVILPWLSFTFDQSLVINIGIILLIMALIGFIFIISGLLGPLLQKCITFVLTGFFPKIGFATNLLLRKTGNKNTSNSVIFAISLAFIFFLNTLQATSINGSIYSLQRQVGSDLVIYTPQINGQSFSEEIYNFTRDYKGIKSGFITANGFYYLIGSNVQVSDNIRFYSFNPAIFGVSSSLPDALMNEISFYPNSNFRTIDNNNTIIISGSMAKVLKVSIGDTVRLDVTSVIQANNQKYGKTMQLRIIAIMKSLPGIPEISDNIEDANRAPVFIGKQTWQTIVQANSGFNETKKFVFEQNIQQIFIKNDGTDLATFKNQIFIKFGSKAFILDYQERLDALLRNLNGSTLILTIILSFSTIIAFFAVISSTLSYVNESKREIAIMKAIGMKEKQIKLIFTLQSIIISFTASILGSLAGYLTGYLAEFNNSLQQSRPMEFVFPPIFVLFTFGLVLFFSVIGSYLPSRRIYKLDTIKNLQ